jgi:hypothetical protein
VTNRNKDADQKGKRIIIGEAVTPAHSSLAVASVSQAARALTELKAELLLAGKIEEKTEAHKSETKRLSKNGTKGAVARSKKYDDLKRWVIERYLKGGAAFINRSGNHVARLLKKEVLDNDEYRQILTPDNMVSTLAKWVNEYRASKKIGA